MQLFPALLADQWSALAVPVRRLHDGASRMLACGGAEVGGDTHLGLRVLRRLLGLPPPATRQPVQITIERSGERETWTRQFGPHRMRSTFRRDDAGHLLERLGPVTFRFRLQRDGDAIDWEFRGARLLGVPVPRRLSGEVRSRSGCKDDRYVFEVDARIPWLGQLVAYRGWLEVVDDR